jgi:hypothetical protein
MDAGGHAMGAKRLAIESSQQQEGRAELREQIRNDLERRGVAAELSQMLSQQLEDEASGANSERYESLLDGVALTCGVQEGAGAELVRSASEIREVERMMSAFAGELSKLDETLEVLAAYVRRMRTGADARNARTLH